MKAKIKRMLAKGDLAEIAGALKELTEDELYELIEMLQKHVGGSPVPEGEYLTVDEASRYLKVCRISLWRYSKMGILKPRKIGSRILFARADIDEYLKKGGNHAEC